MEATSTGTKWLHRAAVALLLICAAPLVAHAYAGQFSRLFADDYCTTSIAHTYGVLGSVNWWYQNWAGLYTNWFIKGVGGMFGSLFSRVAPALGLLLWYAATTWALVQAARALRLTRLRLAAALAATILIYTTTDQTINPFQSLYWMGAIIPYLLPFVFLALHIGLFIRTVDRQPTGTALTGTLALSFVLALISGGLSELAVAFMVAVLGLLGLLSVVFLRGSRRRVALLFVGVTLAGALLALVIVLAAPGNAVREAAIPNAAGSLRDALLMTAYITTAFFASAFTFLSPLALLTTFVIAGLVAFQLHPADAVLFPGRGQIRLLLLIVTVIGGGLLFASLFPLIYVTAQNPQPRHYVLPQAVMAALVFMWGYLMALLLKQRPAQRINWQRSRWLVGVVGLVLLVGPIWSTVQILAITPDLHQYAADWDAREGRIRAAVAAASPT